jgi:hypothetical protein
MAFERTSTHFSFSMAYGAGPSAAMVICSAIVMAKIANPASPEAGAS